MDSPLHIISSVKIAWPVQLGTVEKQLETDQQDADKSSALSTTIQEVADNYMRLGTPHRERQGHGV